MPITVEVGGQVWLSGEVFEPGEERSWGLDMPKMEAVRLWRYPVDEGEVDREAYMLRHVDLGDEEGAPIQQVRVNEVEREAMFMVSAVKVYAMFAQAQE